MKLSQRHDQASPQRPSAVAAGSAPPAYAGGAEGAAADYALEWMVAARTGRRALQ
jgi:hypothetical protein